MSTMAANGRQARDGETRRSVGGSVEGTGVQSRLGDAGVSAVTAAGRARRGRLLLPRGRLQRPVPSSGRLNRRASTWLSTGAQRPVELSLRSGSEVGRGRGRFGPAQPVRRSSVAAAQ